MHKFEKILEIEKHTAGKQMEFLRIIKKRNHWRV